MLPNTLLICTLYMYMYIVCLLHIYPTREWMDSQPDLISSVVYTYMYLSLLPFHVGPTLANLKEQEAHVYLTHQNQGELLVHCIIMQVLVIVCFMYMYMCTC